MKAMTDAEKGEQVQLVPKKLPCSSGLLGPVPNIWEDILQYIYICHCIT